MAERDFQDAHPTMVAMWPAANAKYSALAHVPATNLNAANFLENNDSTRFHRVIGNPIPCGPSQAYVNDLRVILVDPWRGIGHKAGHHAQVEFARSNK